MGSSNAALTDDDSATVTKTDSDSDSATETDEEFCKRYDTFLFREDEKVLAYHSRFIYLAKVLKCEKRSNGWHYFVHYLGWKKNWDEWVGVDRLMKFTEENLQKQEALNKKLKEEKKGEFRTSKRGTSLVSMRHPKGSRGKKQNSDYICKNVLSDSSEKLVNIRIPLTLKKQLINDCEFITHLGKLFALPRTPNVEDILKMYIDYRYKKDNTVSDSVREIFKEICAYFNKALPVILLYKSERKQYRCIFTEDLCPSIVYGAEHLLRLFVKLPELLMRTDIEQKTLLELQQNLVDFLKFLQKNQNALFLSIDHVVEDVETSTSKHDN
ncbi:protein MRG2-like isoform X2 [Hibiscus syriacus]|uniref:protein MRG2-like isoform X2 n=1 Tax=Hibiscus syriacus TaxID=106335 RepID=UPI0019227470|nr:protein MRG2-like isoform X2 [Hibiscus syriacus]